MATPSFHRPLRRAVGLRQVITFLNPDVRMDVVFFLLLTAAASASASTATKPTPTATTMQDYGLLALSLPL